MGTSCSALLETSLEDNEFDINNFVQGDTKSTRSQNQSSKICRKFGKLRNTCPLNLSLFTQVKTILGRLTMRSQEERGC